MTVKYYADSNGTYYGSFENMEPYEGLIEVPAPPDDSRKIWNGEDWIYTPEEAKRISYENLNNDFTRAMQNLQTGWPIYEVLTWDKQATEANAWLAAPEGQKPDTPFLTSLFDKCAALGAQDTLENLIGRVHANDIRYTNDVTAIMAVRHVAEDQIAASDEPMSVTWQFP